MRRNAVAYLLICTAVAIYLATAASASVIYVNANCAGSTHNGSAWSTAYLTIGSAMTGAASGDEIWVAAATYTECVTLTGGVGLYGGFAATETARSQRNWRTNATTVNGGQGGTVITVPGEGVIDGFTITGGRSSEGAGIKCTSAAAPIITNNTVIANVSTVVGGTAGGIYCDAGSQASITNNRIASNTGYGVHIAGSSPVTISNNIIAGNVGGIVCSYPMAAGTSVTGNTIVANTNTGIFCFHQPFTIANNIIAYNSNVAISSGGSGGNPIVENNCVYGNGGGYSGIGPGTGDIYEDPAFADRPGGDYHLTGSSPCLNTGLNSAPGIASVDMDGEARTYDGIVDIGADEYSSPFIHRPTISPGSGTYDQPQSVVVSCDTSGAVIHYTTDGNEPTELSPVVTSGDSVAITTSGTLKVKAFKSGLAPSATTTGVYTLAVATPAFSPDGYVGDTLQTVGISCASPGTTIHYTTNGIDPTESDPTIASGGTISMDHSMILKARAYRTGWTPSSVKTAIYRLGFRLYVWADSPGPDHNGFSWQTAYQSVNSALSTAVSGDEIWVARGTYVGNVAMKDGVALYGGFTGDETAVSQRDWPANETVLDGNQTGSVVSVLSGVTASSRIDGFTITNGRSSAGGGICCYQGATVIANNKITGNTATGNGWITGGGVSFNLSTGSTIENCIISGNTANYGGGICTNSSVLTAVNNTVVGNTATTEGGGVCWAATNGTLENNVIAYNSSGVYKGQSIPPTFDYNCVHANIAYDYYGVSASAHDVSADPQFVDRANGDYHIMASSPCVDVGLNTAPAIPSSDIDGQPRVANATVDIGADEYCAMVATPTLTPDSGTYDSAQSVIVHCATSGATMRYTTNGDAPTESDPTVAEGGVIPVNMSLVLKVGAWKSGLERSYIKTASYTITAVAAPEFSPDGGISNLAIPVTVTCPTPGAAIHYTVNGADPTESDPAVASGGAVSVGSTSTLKARAFKAGLTESPAKSADYTITSVLHVDADAPGPAHDGFTWQSAFLSVQDAIDAAIPGNEVWVAAGAYYESTTLQDGVGLYGGFAGTEANRSQRNWTLNVTELHAKGYTSAVAVPADAGSGTVISGFTITDGNTDFGGGIYCDSASPTVENNVIAGNYALYDGGGIFCAGKSSAIISNNLLLRNRADRFGGGIACSGCESLVANNTFFDNAAFDGGAFSCTRESVATFANNIVAYNSSGIFGYEGMPVLLNNYVGQNTDYDYDEVDPGPKDVTDANGPGFVDANSPDFHLISGSICIDNGDDSVVDGHWVDMDGKTRTSGAHVEIGAYEHGPVPTPVFAPDGGLSNRPISVVVTCSLVGAAIHYTTNGADPTLSDPTVASGGTVTISSTATLKARAFKSGWSQSAVKSALYTITNSVYVDQNAPGPVHDGLTWQSACLTIGDALGVAIEGNEVWVADGVYEESIKLPAGIALYGGFSGTEAARWERDWTVNASVIDAGCKDSVIYVAAGATTATVIDGFTIRNGSSSSAGGGINCTEASPTISNNVITNNQAAEHGGGVACLASSPAIRNNLFLNNSSPEGCAISCVDGSRAQIANNSVVQNGQTSGGGAISALTTALPALVNNIVAFNRCGLLCDGGGMKLYNNCVYSNAVFDYAGVSPAATDIATDPLFVDSASGNYRLQAGSPCIDAGTNRYAPTADYGGAIRPQDGDTDAVAAWDIGAYEYPLNLFEARKTYPDGASIAFGDASVTAQFAGQVYVERPDRTAGIRIDTPDTFAIGAVVNVSGVIQSDPSTGERYVAATAPWPDRFGGLRQVAPLAFTNRNLGGGESGMQQGVAGASGLNNTGLLAVTCGAVVDMDTNTPKTWFSIDDGSGVGVRVTVPSGVTIDPAWRYVIVRGISSGEVVAGTIRRVIRVRSSSDIRSF